jgi:hypothetical protein
MPGKGFNAAMHPDGHLAIECRNGHVYMLNVDLHNGQLLTQRQSSVLGHWHGLAGYSEEGLVMRHFPNRQNPDPVQLFNYDLSTDTLGDMADVGKMLRAPVGLPILYSPGTDGFNLVARYLAKPIVAGVEYREWLDENIVINYYLQNSQGLERWLMVLKNGEQVFHVCQDKQMNGFASGSFFTFANRLIFVKESKTLEVYEI